MKDKEISINKYLTHPVLLHLEKLTGIAPANVPIQDEALYCNLLSDAAGIPELGTAFMQCLISKTRADSYDDLIKLFGLAHGAGTWKDNADILIESGKCTLSEVIADREDIISCLEKNGIVADKVQTITKQIYRGGVHKNGFDIETEKLLRERGVPDWFLESCKKIEYLAPRALAISNLNIVVRIIWFKLHHPTAVNAITIPPELGKSCAEVYTVEGDKLRQPYISIGGIGSRFAQRLEECAKPKENYVSYRDLKEKVGLSMIAVDALDEAGLLSGIGDG